MNFKELMIRAKENDLAAKKKLLDMYRPLLLKESIVEGHYDEDLYQDLCLTLLYCVHKFGV
ncbi:helix-turn-helix domain-containing protein [Anaerotignum sp.]|uniref:helix-turn-helix domain-containing protein n=1 Tax=Anaerotignum sp. TaxID=2039241 RepID=UPI0028B188D4|nr:helix-turn-helix domain-containing protein [Anaerotignum sp.]